MQWTMGTRQRLHKVQHAFSNEFHFVVLIDLLCTKCNRFNLDFSSRLVCGGPIWLNLPKSEAVNQCWAGTPVLGWLEQLVLAAVSKSRTEIGSDFWNWFQNQFQKQNWNFFFQFQNWNCIPGSIYVWNQNWNWIFWGIVSEKITTIIRVNCWMQFKLPRTGLEKLKWILKILF